MKLYKIYFKYINGLQMHQNTSFFYYTPMMIISMISNNILESIFVTYS